MPPRKSGGDARRSDVSTARFALANDVDGDVSMTQHDMPPPGSAEPVVVAAGPSTPSNFPLPPAGLSQAAEQEQPQQHTPAEKKDKEKEREKDAISIEDLNLPKSIITRLAKGVLPSNTQIQANAILALSKSATVFISHLANAANEFTVSANKKTIMPADVFKALDEIEYGFMREKLEAEFTKFNQIQTSKRSSYRKRVAEAKKGATCGDAAHHPHGEGSILGDTSLLSIAAAADKTDPPATGGTEEAEARAVKKMRVDERAKAGGADDTRDGAEVSDAETVPDEEVEEDEDDEEAEEEEDEDEEEEGADEREGDDDRLAVEEEDEALDDGEDSE